MSFVRGMTVEQRKGRVKDDSVLRSNVSIYESEPSIQQKVTPATLSLMGTVIAQAKCEIGHHGLIIAPEIYRNVL